MKYLWSACPNRSPYGLGTKRCDFFVPTFRTIITWRSKPFSFRETRIIPFDMPWHKWMAYYSNHHTHPPVVSSPSLAWQVTFSHWKAVVVLEPTVSVSTEGLKAPTEAPVAHVEGISGRYVSKDALWCRLTKWLAYSLASKILGVIITYQPRRVSFWSASRWTKLYICLPSEYDVENHVKGVNWRIW